MKGSRLPVAAGLLCVAGIIAGLAGQAQALGLVAVALLLVLCLLALSAGGLLSARTGTALVAFALAFGALVLLAGRLHRPSEPLRTLAGFPPGTAMLVLGIAPLGLTLGIIYGLAFKSEVLPLRRQREFLSRHGRN